MKITVNLDTQAVLTQPSLLRIKAGAFVPVAITFTSGSQVVPIAQGAVIEIAIKPRNQLTGDLLAYLNTFQLAAGNLYTGTLNCASQSLLDALGLNNSTPVAQLETIAEVTWTVNGQKFRSITFPVIIEAPVTDDNPVPAPDPELYPAPDDIVVKSDLAAVATSGNYNDLLNQPTLGSAASQDATNFATAAQGAKADSAVQPGQLAPVATSGNYGDLQGLPTIPAPQISSDWNATSGVAQILNKPTLGSASAYDAADFATAAQGQTADTAVQPAQLAVVATSGSYNDLANKPVLGTAASHDAGDFASAAQGAIANTAVQPAQLAAVATSGNYNDLANKPTLGSAAPHDAGDFATAAQGAIADTAVQPGQLATVATSGNYNDLSDTPVLGSAAIQPSTAFDPTGAANAAQAYSVQRANHTGTQLAATISDFATAASNAVTWTTLSGKPTLAAVATSGSYNDLANKPVLGTASSHNVADFATEAQGAMADTAVQPGQLATVATSGNYNDLSAKPVLGTAATQNVSAFATAAQGAKSDAVAAVSGLVKVAGGIFSAAKPESITPMATSKSSLVSTTRFRVICSPTTARF